MGDHLVDQQLEQQRRGEGDQRGHRGDQGDVEKRAVLAQDFRQEPAEAEGPWLLPRRPGAPAGDEQAAPAGHETIARDAADAVLLAARVEDGGGGSVGPVERVHHDEPVAVLLQRHDREGAVERRQAPPCAGPHRPALEPGPAHHPRDRAERVGFGEFGEILRRQLHAGVQGDDEQAAHRRMGGREGEGRRRGGGGRFAGVRSRIHGRPPWSLLRACGVMPL